MNSRPPPPSAPMLTLPENSRIRSVTSGRFGKRCSETNCDSRDSASSEPNARSRLNTIAVTGTSDSAVWNASAAACCGHLSRAHWARIRSDSR